MLNKILQGLLLTACGLALLTQFALPVQAEVTRDTINSKGQERSFLLDLPDDASRHVPLPTVVALHDAWMSNTGMRQIFRMKTTSKQGDKVAVVYPKGIRHSWEDGRSAQQSKSLRDIEFLKELAQHLVNKGIADRKRIYLVGFSIGGMLTYRVACFAPDTFAAFAVILASMPENSVKNCPNKRDVPILIIGATDDRFAPWNGGALGLKSLFGGRVLSIDETVKFWRDRNTCSNQANIGAMPDKVESDHSRALAFQYVDCKSKSPVVFIKIQGGGHQMPGTKSGPITEQTLGKANQDFSAAEVSWKFLQHFTLRN